TEVYPIMQKYHIPATNFVIVSTIDNRKSAGRPKLTWEQMREMKRNGMSFFSHTYNSHVYTVVNEQGSLRPMLSKPEYLKKLHRKETRTEFTAKVKKDLKRAEDRLKQMLGNTY
ncbi:polysaccharide deacetylase family protein, partial [Enterobacter quasiroggenkampii]|nr:polysaccharide deacetylase family protein [Enterobacter quasiroggenkampii]